jgi:YARHG domain
MDKATRTIGFLVFCFFAPVSAQAGDGPEFWSCSELWQNRNQIYKDAGYCFRTQRGIRVFGNAGCQYDDVSDVPLSINQRRDVAEITRYERLKRCPR